MFFTYKSQLKYLRSSSRSAFMKLFIFILFAFRTHWLERFEFVERVFVLSCTMGGYQEKFWNFKSTGVTTPFYSFYSLFFHFPVPLCFFLSLYSFSSLYSALLFYVSSLFFSWIRLNWQKYVGVCVFYLSEIHWSLELTWNCVNSISW